MPTDSPATWSAIILAAGEGTRMKSSRPKVLHEIAGRPWCPGWCRPRSMPARPAAWSWWVMGEDDVERSSSTEFGERVEMVLQPEQRGTGDAVRCAMEADRALEGRLVVLYGDCPLIPVGLLDDLVDHSDRAGAELGLVTATLGRSKRLRPNRPQRRR